MEAIWYQPFLSCWSYWMMKPSGKSLKVPVQRQSCSSAEATAWSSTCLLSTLAINPALLSSSVQVHKTYHPWNMQACLEMNKYHQHHLVHHHWPFLRCKHENLSNWVPCGCKIPFQFVLSKYSFWIIGLFVRIAWWKRTFWTEPFFLKQVLNYT